MPGVSSSQRRRRVTYVLPLPTEPLPQLVLPSDNGRRPGEPRPLVVRRDQLPLFAPADPATAITTQRPAGHPQHRLGVSALALDLSTIVVSKDDESREPSPRGILYSAGRDGLLASWELGLPMRKRRKRYGSGRAARLSRAVRWGDAEADEEAVEDESDEDDGVRETARKVRRSSSSMPFGQTEDLLDGRRPSQAERSKSPSLAYEERWEVDAEALEVPPRTGFRQSVRPHTDWINAIALCNLNRTVITASSDHTVRAWSPHDKQSSMKPVTIGQHADYVKTLAVSRDAGWVASGGFDRQVKLWDVHESRSSPMVQLPEDALPNSIYSLATNAAGSLLAVGSPERIVRVFDPRSAKQTCRLVGHTDNVRCMLLSDDGQLLLTGSSDSNIKLWSLREQRCLQTFSFHSESVWSLYSNHPYLDSFYSGDRTGLVCKTDMEGCRDYADGDCVVLLGEGDHSNDTSGASGINCIVAADDAYVWTATGSSSIKRWEDVPSRASRNRVAMATRSSAIEATLADSEGTTESSVHTPATPVNLSPLALRKSRHSSSGLDRASPTVSFAPEPTRILDLQRTISETSTRSLPRATSSPLAVAPPHRPPSLRLSSNTPQRPSISVTDSPGATYHTSPEPASPTLRGLPYDNLVPLISLADPYQPRYFAHAEHPVSSAFSARSFPSHRGTFSIASHHSFSGHTPLNEQPPQVHDPTRQAREEYEAREEAADAVPLRAMPVEIIEGLCGLVACETLNDRRHVITVDKNGDLALWDIVLGLCLGGFARSDVDRALGYDENEEGGGETRRGGRPIKDALELVRERVEGEAATSGWASVDVRTGGLSVHLEEARVFDGEHYADTAGFADFLKLPHQRVNLGKTVLRALFDGFIEEELRLRTASLQPYALQQHLATTDAPTRLQRPKAPLHISLAGLPEQQSKGASVTTAGGLSIALATPALTSVLPPVAADQAAKLRSRDPSLTPIPQSPAALPNRSLSLERGVVSTPRAMDQSDYFNTSGGTGKSSNEAPMSPTTTATGTPGGFMGRLKGFGRKAKGGADTPAKEGPDALASATSNGGIAPNPALAHLSPGEIQQLNVLRTVFAKPLTPCPADEAPPIEMSPSVIVTIAEEAPESTTWQSIYRGTASTTGAEAQAVEMASPAWLLEFLMGNRVAARDPVKVSFVMTAWHSPEEAGLDELPDGGSRLSANRVLRIAKVANYCADRLNELAAQPAGTGDTASAAAGAKRTVSHVSLASAAIQSRRGSIASDEEARLSGDDLEILIGEIVLPPTITLAAALRFWQRRPGDLLLNYRLRP